MSLSFRVVRKALGPAWIAVLAITAPGPGSGDGGAGHEDETRAKITAAYSGPISFANDLDCFR